MQVGNHIKSFTIQSIVDGFGYSYDDKGKKTKYATQFMLLLGINGQQRVLEVGKSNLNDCVKYYAWSKFKFADWSMIEKVSTK
jgi:hypothetical protein